MAAALRRPAPFVAVQVSFRPVGRVLFTIVVCPQPAEEAIPLSGSTADQFTMTGACVYHLCKPLGEDGLTDGAIDGAVVSEPTTNACGLADPSLYEPPAVQLPAEAQETEITRALPPPL